MSSKFARFESPLTHLSFSFFLLLSSKVGFKTKWRETTGLRDLEQDGGLGFKTTWRTEEEDGGLGLKKQDGGLGLELRETKWRLRVQNKMAA